MTRRKQESKAADLEPLAISPMDSAELEEIGIRLFGRVGWPIKVARIVSRDATTVRRWRAGGQVEPVYAKMIRDYAANVDPAAPSWEPAPSQSGADALRALAIVARVQALANLGVSISLRVAQDEDGLSLQLRRPGHAPLVAWQESGGCFCGLQEIEDWLAGIAAGLVR
jgi:hypothetical protein